MQAEQVIEKLDNLENTSTEEIPKELVVAVIGLLPQIFNLLSRKSLRKQVELQGKLIQIIMQKLNIK